jgi:hypothetical protein
MAADHRTETGVLEQHYRWFFVRTKAGHRWRIEGDQRRFEYLRGMSVEVTGRVVRGTIIVEGVRPT